jgi:hypothetical protein
VLKSRYKPETGRKFEPSVTDHVSSIDFAKEIAQDRILISLCKDHLVAILFPLMF